MGQKVDPKGLRMGISQTWTSRWFFSNKKTFKEVGEMNDEGSLEFVKAEWAMSAIEYGCKFKAIIGSKMC